MIRSLEYFSELLDVFLMSEKAHIDFNDLENSGIEVSVNGELSEKLVFHLQLALDNELIGKRTGNAYNIADLGIIYSLDGKASIAITPIRLSQKGHDFALSLNNKEVMQKLKSEFKDAPFTVLFDGGQKLLQHFMKKKLDEIID